MAAADQREGPLMDATVDVAGAEMKIYDPEPEQQARAAVVVLQEAFGITDHIKDVCRRFSGEGYRTVAPHLYHRTGDPIVQYGHSEGTKEQALQLTRPALEAD